MSESLACPEIMQFLGERVQLVPATCHPESDTGSAADLARQHTVNCTPDAPFFPRSPVALAQEQARWHAPKTCEATDHDCRSRPGSLPDGTTSQACAIYGRFFRSITAETTVRARTARPNFMDLHRRAKPCRAKWPPGIRRARWGGAPAPPHLPAGRRGERRSTGCRGLLTPWPRQCALHRRRAAFRLQNYEMLPRAISSDTRLTLANIGEVRKELSKRGSRIYQQRQGGSRSRRDHDVHVPPAFRPRRWSRQAEVRPSGSWHAGGLSGTRTGVRRPRNTRVLERCLWQR